mgnify:CR=1 FL=1
MNISIYDWIFAFLTCISFLSGILLIPSIISIKKMGFKNYTKQIKTLVNLYSRVNECYSITKTNTYNIGNGRTFTDTSTIFFYPVYKSVNKLYIINSRAGFFESINISEHDFNIDSKWKNNYFEIKTSVCLITQFLINRFKKRLSEKAKNSTHLSDKDELNKLLNSEATSNRREYLLNQIFNE